MARMDYTDLLICFYWAMDSLTRPTLRNLTAGYEEFEHRRDVQGLLQALRRDGLIERTGRTGRAVYRLTEEGRRRAQPADPTVQWNRRWDGLWRVLTFDLPAQRKQDRIRLWRAFREWRFGLLQQSVWIWPHAMESALKEIVEVTGVPECFCGFESRRLFLCTDQELVSTAWDFEDIHRRQQAYLERLTGTTTQVRQAASATELAKAARQEWRAYQSAFEFDPLLPRVLLPRGYQGERVHQEHVAFVRLCAQRYRLLAETEG